MIQISVFDISAEFDENTKLLSIHGDTVGKFKGLKEAKEYCMGIHLSNELLSDSKEAHEHKTQNITDSEIAIALKESSEVKPTESMVKYYKEMFETKHFFPSNILLSLRESHKDIPFVGKIDYIMRDGSKILLDVETNKKLNKISKLTESPELLSYMIKNSLNFIKITDSLVFRENKG